MTNENKFHLCAGTFIAGKVFTEYCYLYRDELKTGLKGERTLQNRLLEAEAKTVKCIDLMAQQLQAIGVDLSVPEHEIGKIEDCIFKVLQLDEEQREMVIKYMDSLKQVEV